MAITDDEMIKIIEKVSPSVVNINTVRLVHDYYMNVVPLRQDISGTGRRRISKRIFRSSR
jgi:S1-C subfamily serine protease